jgi:site-specific DNA-methyltransferase (adenine-specific)
MVLTDPPYLVSYSGRWGSNWGVIKGDTDPSWVLPVYRELWRALMPDSLCITFYGWPSADVSSTPGT